MLSCEKTAGILTPENAQSIIKEYYFQNSIRMQDRWIRTFVANMFAGFVCINERKERVFK